jgi:hypothetical protein
MPSGRSRRTAAVDEIQPQEVSQACHRSQEIHCCQSALNPSAFLQAIKQWIEGGGIEADSPAGAFLDEFGNLVTVSWSGLDERQDQKLGTEHQSQLQELLRIYLDLLHVGMYM